MRSPIAPTAGKGRPSIRRASAQSWRSSVMIQQRNPHTRPKRSVPRLAAWAGAKGERRQQGRELPASRLPSREWLRPARLLPGTAAAVGSPAISAAAADSRALGAIADAHQEVDLIALSLAGAMAFPVPAALAFPDREGRLPVLVKWAARGFLRLLPEPEFLHEEGQGQPPPRFGNIHAHSSGRVGSVFEGRDLAQPIADEASAGQMDRVKSTPDDSRRLRVSFDTPQRSARFWREKSCSVWGRGLVGAGWLIYL